MTKSLSVHQYGGGKRRWSNKCNFYIQRCRTNCLISRVPVIFGVRRISRMDCDDNNDVFLDGLKNDIGLMS
jgi:hypothetical protein